MPSIEARLVALERRIGQSQADYMGPSDQFEGEIFASGGVKILASTINTPPDTRKVRWVRESDPSKTVGYIATLDLAPADGDMGAMLLSANELQDRANGQMFFQAFGSGHANRRAFLQMDGAATDTNTRILAGIGRGVGGTLSRKIIDGAGKSDYAQNLDESFRLLGGVYSTAGAVFAKLNGAGWSGVRNGVGDVTVTFDTAFPVGDRPRLGLSTGADIALFTALSNVSMRIKTYTVGPTAAAEASVSFLLAGLTA